MSLFQNQNQNSFYDNQNQNTEQIQFIEKYNKNVQTLSFYDIVKQKQQEQEKKNYTQKQISTQLIPTFNVISEFEVQCLIGEIYVVYDFDNYHYQSNRASCMNAFKRIEYIKLHKQNKFLEIKLEQKVSSLKYFEDIAQKLIQYPQKEVHVFGILLQKYQQVCFKIYEQLQTLKPYLNMSSESIEQFYIQRNQFEQRKQIILNSFNQEEFTYIVDQSLNLQTSEFIINNIYFSEPLLMLMGTNPEQYQRYLHRFGMNEFIDSKSSLIMNIILMKSILKTFVSSIDEPELQDIHEEEDFYVNFHTFDNIQLSAKMIFNIIIPDQNQQVQSNNYSSQTFMLMEFKLDFEPNVLQQLIQLRQNQQSNNLSVYDVGYINDIDFSLDYSIQSEIFQERLNKLESIFKSYKNLKQQQFKVMKPQSQINYNQVQIQKQ